MNSVERSKILSRINITLGKRYGISNLTLTTMILKRDFLDRNI
jgi:hypothetical protein